MNSPNNKKKLISAFKGIMFSRERSNSECLHLKYTQLEFVFQQKFEIKKNYIFMGFTKKIKPKNIRTSFSFFSIKDFRQVKTSSIKMHHFYQDLLLVHKKSKMKISATRLGLSYFISI